MPYDASTDPGAKIAKVLCRLIDAAKAARDPHLKMRDELRKYAYDKDFAFMYQDVQEEMFFKAKIAKAAEFLEIMGAALYPTNPKAMVQSAEFATPTQRQRHKIEEQYADYAFRQGDLQTHGTRMVYEALLGGRGVMWTGHNGRKGVVQSVFDTVDNLLLDPDAKNREEINWVSRRRLRPRWQVSSEHTERADAIAAIEKHSEKPSDAKAYEPASELIEYYEVWSLVPLTHYAPSVGKDEEAQAMMAQVEGPAKYIFSDKILIAVEPWEIPFFDDDFWPCEWFDPLEKPGCLWPAAPLETSIGHIKALNWIYTLYLSKMRVTTRTALVVLTQNGQGIKDDQIVKILKGKDMEIVKVTVNGSTLKLSDLVQQFKFETGVEEFERFAAIVGQAFEKASGLYEVLYTGTTPTQIRNAATANMISQSSQSRVSNMQARMEQFMSRLTRKTLFAARFIEGPEEISRKFGPQAGAMWGTLAPPEVVAQERQMRAETKQMIIQQNTMQAMSMGMDPMMPPPPPPDPAMMDQQAEQQLGPEQLVSMDEWINDAARQVAAGSMRPLSPQQQVDNLNVALNQLAPAIATVPGGVGLVAAIAQEFAKVNQYSRDFQDAAAKFAAQAQAVSDMQVNQAMMPPPPPEPDADEGTPEKGPQAGPSGGTPTI